MSSRQRSSTTTTESTGITAPEVSSAQLGSYVGRTVSLTVKILQLLGDRAIIEACDGGQLEVSLRSCPDVHLSNPYAYIKCHVNGPNAVTLLSAKDLGNLNFPVGLVDEMVKMTHEPRFKEYFWGNKKAQ
ncbi:hypothetical protein EXIGLDRAFT_717665 [Exidia glandulosa HHB12029]|uniref:Replication factor A protein 3 n=1 Tax=Exidia glandulosa HHB12029 TaxID=1314781 RepID=A0A165I7K5_EXIGL|nr:hypothetical protein EXIGLDRAFT_717665 [Exidia glandulosa HHB12029]